MEENNLIYVVTDYEENYNEKYIVGIYSNYIKAFLAAVTCALKNEELFEDESQVMNYDYNSHIDKLYLDDTIIL